MCRFQLRAQAGRSAKACNLCSQWSSWRGACVQPTALQTSGSCASALRSSLWAQLVSSQLAELRDTISLSMSAGGADLPGRVNVIVSEILDSQLLGEGVLPTMRHAARLLKVLL